MNDKPQYSFYSSMDYGRYNLCTTGKQYLVSIRAVVDGETVNTSQTFDEEPNYDDAPAEVIDLLECRMKQWLFSSSRATDEAKLNKLKAALPQLTIAWAKRKIELLERQLKQMNNAVQDAMDELESREEA